MKDGDIVRFKKNVPIMLNGHELAIEVKQGQEGTIVSSGLESIAVELPHIQPPLAIAVDRKDLEVIKGFSSIKDKIFNAIKDASKRFDSYDRVPVETIKSILDTYLDEDGYKLGFKKRGSNDTTHTVQKN